MSSDGSVSSRISQFGLYRTIDARTEEFLKLSKKRQIKQGCVCAAISTALTVTIVVCLTTSDSHCMTVLLIYEYNVIAEARRSNHKTTWLGLMNNSADDPKLLEILNKEKIDIDKTTLKLLPILLKALNQNRYMEKVIEEPTSLYVPYGKEVTTETTITKNIFADTRNWMKTPPSRLYTIEYKTSPIVYFKNPTRNIEYFTKIRKIRDYQRILNYVDKMISEKNSLGTTQPMRRDYSYTEKPYKMTTRKLNNRQKVVNKQKTLKAVVKENKTNCKCSDKLSEVMKKLLNSIQQLLSYFSGSNSKQIVPCKNNRPLQTKPLKSLNESPTNKNIHKMITEDHNTFKPKLIKTPSYNTFLNRHRYDIDTPTKKIDIRRDHTVNAIMNLIKPSFNKHNDIDLNFESNEALITTDSYMKSSNTNDIAKESSKKSDAAHLQNTHTKILTDTVTTVADYILQKGTYDVSTDMKSSLSTYPETDFSDEDDYTETTETTTITANNLSNLDTYSPELKKSNLVLQRKKLSNEDKSHPFKGPRLSQKLSNNFKSMRKMGNLVPKNKDISTFSTSKHRFAPILNKNFSLPTIQTTTKSNHKMNTTLTVKPTTNPTAKTTTIKIQTKTKKLDVKYITTKQNRTRNITSEQQTVKTQNENNSKETTLRHIEEAIMVLNNETSANKVENDDKVLADSYQWEIVRLEENATAAKSMMPMGRSTYLEMQRNDWKHDENNEFDNDINYIFD